MPEANDTPTTPAAAPNLAALALDAQNAVDALRDFDPLLRALASSPSKIEAPALDPVADAYAERLRQALAAVAKLRAAVAPRSAVA